MSNSDDEPPPTPRKRSKRKRNDPFNQLKDTLEKRKDKPKVDNNPPQPQQGDEIASAAELLEKIRNSTTIQLEKVLAGVVEPKTPPKQPPQPPQPPQNEDEEDIVPELKFNIVIVDELDAKNRPPPSRDFVPPFGQRMPSRHPPEIQQKLDEVNAEITKINGSQVALKDRILLSDLDINIKANAMQKLKNISHPSDASKSNIWASTLMQIPFGKYSTLPVRLQDGSRLIQKYLGRRQRTLDESVYGLTEVKEQIIDFLARNIRNPNSKGNVLALEGPPGVGKTKLIKVGISSALNRPFEVINFGGLKDASLLDGHDFTYIGAKPGRLVQILINAQKMDPVIYLDEVDKIPERHFDEISGILTHLLDEEQNSEFMDHYFQGIPLDLSRALFVVSFNDLSKVNGIVSDRMKIIKVPSPNLEDKVAIATQHMIPEILHSLRLRLEDVVFQTDVLKYIIQEKTEKEEGVRKFKKNLESVIEKLNTLDLISESKKTSKSLNLSYQTGILKSVNLPITVTTEMVDLLITAKENNNHLGMYT